MLIKVTEDHIRRGRRQSICKCPIALAIMEAVPTRLLIVGPNVVSIDIGEFLLPKEAQDFIGDFDFEKKKVSPFEFELVERMDF
jgi:hypothetical protein